VQVALLLAAIRLVLAAAGLGAAIARGVRPAVAGATFVFGIAALAFGIITSRQGRWSGRDVHTPHPWRAALAATYPSTRLLTFLTIVSLILKPQLAALTAGLLAGLAFVAAAAAASIAWSRRS
jgi:hypothetical protein